MICVQAIGCAPVVKAFEARKPTSEMWTGAETAAAGLRVPKPYGDYLILDILKKSGGVAIAATDDEIFDGVRHWAQTEGLFACPEGAAALVAYQKLLTAGYFHPQDRVVLFNTGSGLKYIDVTAKAMRIGQPELPKSREIGGIIGPY
jgi:threonine synthase